MNTVGKIEVDFDDILDVALRGVRRASMFMGFGVNAALSDACNEYQLTRITQIQLLPDKLTADELDKAKHEFRLWIEANGFRELIGTFHVFLDAINLACLKFRLGKHELSLQQLHAEHSGFSRQGFPKKLDILQHSARNVFTHRLSVVRKKDLNAREFLRVSWLGSDIFIEESNGTRHPIEDVIVQRKSFPEETSLMMQFSTRNRNFRVGERLVLSSRDLAEICWFMSREARSLASSLVEHAKNIGIEVLTKQTQQTPAADAGNPRG